MAGMSTYLEAKVQDNIFNQAAYSVPTTVYLALFTDDPGDDNSGTEVTGGSYARVAVTSASELSRTLNVVSNSAQKAFPTATVSWGTVTHFALFDALTVGNQLWNGALTVSKLISIAETPTFAIGDVTFTLG